MAAHAAYAWRPPRREWLSNVLWADSPVFLAVAFLMLGDEIGVDKQQLDEWATHVLFVGVVWLVLVTVLLARKCSALHSPQDHTTTPGRS
jgi:hypothetical protein